MQQEAGNRQTDPVPPAHGILARTRRRGRFSALSVGRYACEFPCCHADDQHIEPSPRNLPIMSVVIDLEVLSVDWLQLLVPQTYVAGAEDASSYGEGKEKTA